MCQLVMTGAGMSCGGWVGAEMGEHFQYFMENVIMKTLTLLSK